MENNLPYRVVKACSVPLSSDVFIINGEHHTYCFDCGNSPEALSQIKEITKPIIIISHFHADHIGNRNQIDGKFIVSNYTSKYFINKEIEIITEPLLIEDGVSLLITPIPSTHAKGSLILTLNSTYTFLGDSYYGMVKNDEAVYNAGLLAAEISFLEKLKTKYFINSHDSDRLIPKDKLIINLKEMLTKRTKDNPYISID